MTSAPLRCMHTLFEEQVAANPLALAVRDDGAHSPRGQEGFTYQELDAAAEIVARALRRAGVGPESRVAVCLHRSTAMIIALYGVLKSGGAFVCLDPTHPAARKTFVLGDCAATIILTQDGILGDFITPPGVQIIMLSGAGEVINGGWWEGEDPLGGEAPTHTYHTTSIH